LLLVVLASTETNDGQGTSKSRKYFLFLRLVFALVKRKNIYKYRAYNITFALCVYTFFRH
jgi:hypothetical protein